MDIKELDEMVESNMAIVECELSILEYGYCMKLSKLYTNFRKGLITLEGYQTAKGELAKEYMEPPGRAKKVSNPQLAIARKNLGRKVRLVISHHRVDGEYTLNSIIVKAKEGRVTYSVELLDSCGRSSIVASLEDIRELSDNRI